MKKKSHFYMNNSFLKKNSISKENEVFSMKKVNSISKENEVFSMKKVN